MSASQTRAKKDRQWAPRFWQGCNFFAWMRLLIHNRFAVQLPYWYIAAIVTPVSIVHSVIQLFEEIFYRHRVRRTPIRRPLFILGHWRSGTTLLHELMILDPRHSFPNTYQCLEPNHFILTEWLFTRIFAWLLPRRRQMDNMPAGWHRPQEDEFALCMLGTPSPYLSLAFPNHPRMDQEYLDLRSLPLSARRRWKRSLKTFLKKVAFKNPKRLVLKSPTHTARVRHLLDMFPDAQFVHIVRDPFVVFASTINLWKSLSSKHCLETPRFDELPERVFSTFVQMYERFEEDRKLIEPGHFHELKYEDLVRDPMGEMKRVYESLDLGDFELAAPRIREYLDQSKGYETNKYDITPEMRSEIARRWGHFFRQYGYSID